MSLAQLWRPQRFVSDTALFPAVQAKGRENLTEQFAYIEAILCDGRAWAVFDRFSVVDVFLLVFWRWGGRVGFDMHGAYPSWTAMTARTLRRSAVRRAIDQEGLATESPFDSLIG